MRFAGEIDVSSEYGLWVYKIPCCVISEGKISFDFEGVKDGCKFKGCCIVNELNSREYSGVGKFQYEGYEAYESPIDMSMSLVGSLLEISGRWLEDGVVYRMNGELERVI